MKLWKDGEGQDQPSEEQKDEGMEQEAPKLRLIQIIHSKMEAKVEIRGKRNGNTPTDARQIWASLCLS